MRVTDSRTATARGSPVPLPDLTRATASLGWLIFVGCNVGSIRAVGAAELPPDTVDWLPIRVRSLPFAPALAMPYMGLCGLLPVSFCDSAQITAPFVPAAVTGVVICALSQNDTGNNPHNPMYGLLPVSFCDSA